jgi:hypothetical protein
MHCGHDVTKQSQWPCQELNTVHSVRYVTDGHFCTTETTSRDAINLEPSNSKTELKETSQGPSAALQKLKLLYHILLHF